MKNNSKVGKEKLEQVFKHSYPELDKEIDDVCLDIKYRKKCSGNKINIQLNFKAFIAVTLIVSVTTLLLFIIYLNMN